MKENELKPCKKCGNSKRYERGVVPLSETGLIKDKLFYVSCVDCRYTSYGEQSQKMADLAWNTRAGEEQ